MEHDHTAVDTPIGAPEVGALPGVVRLYVGIVVAPLAWSLHLLFCYSIAAHACFPMDVALSRPVWPNLWTVIAGATAIAWLTVATGGCVAWLNWKAIGSASGAALRLLQSGDGRSRFMALCGLLVSSLFAVTLFFTSTGVFLAPDCSP